MRAADPLGAPLYSGATAVSTGSGEGEGGKGEEEGGAGEVADVRAWERGREGYLNWEADRIIAKSKRGAAGAMGATATSAAAGGGGGESRCRGRRCDAGRRGRRFKDAQEETYSHCTDFVQEEDAGDCWSFAFVMQIYTTYRRRDMVSLNTTASQTLSGERRSHST